MLVEVPSCGVRCNIEPLISGGLWNKGLDRHSTMIAPTTTHADLRVAKSGDRRSAL